MAIPLLPYAPITQNARVERIRVGSDEDLKVVALDQSMDADNLKTVIEAAYRQIFFHAFKSDIALKGVEKDLAIRRLNNRLEVVGVHRLVEGYDLEVFVRAHANPLHPGVLGDGRVRQEGNSHSVVSIRRR